MEKQVKRYEFSKKRGGLQGDSQGEYACLNRWVLICDLKIVSVSMLPMSGGRGFRRCGTNQLKGLDPMVVMCARGIVRLMEDDDLRVCLGVFMWMGSVKYGGLSLWGALKGRRMIL